MKPAAISSLLIFSVGLTTILAQEEPSFFGIPLGKNTTTTTTTTDSPAAELIPIPLEDDSAPENTELPEAAKSLQEKYRQAAAIVSAPLRELSDLYVKRLESAAATHQQSGDLALLLAFKKEIEEVKSGKHPSQFGVDDLSAAIVESRRLFLQSAISRDAERAQLLSQVNGAYRTELRKISDSLTLAGDFGGAKKIEVTIESIPARALPDYKLLHAESFPARAMMATSTLINCPLTCQYDGSYIYASYVNQKDRGVQMRLAKGNRLKIQYASKFNSSTSRLRINGSDAGIIRFEKTGNWEKFAEHSHDVEIPDGARVELFQESGAVNLVSIESIRSGRVNPSRPPSRPPVSFGSFIKKYPGATWKGRSIYNQRNTATVRFADGRFVFDSFNDWSEKYTEKTDEQGNPILQFTHAKFGIPFEITFLHDFRVCKINALDGKKKKSVALQLVEL